MASTPLASGNRPPVATPQSKQIIFQRENNPLFVALSDNDLDQFKTLVESGKPINTKNFRGATLLARAIEEKRVDFFDYLLTLADVNIDEKLQFGRSPLLFTTTVSAPAYFALKLIENGANIHEQDDSGFTYLHLAARSKNQDTLELGRLIIEKGADINARACYNMTPLYVASEEGNFDWVSMLLYYGADATVPSTKGVFPVAVVSSFIPLEQQTELQEILFNYTFDGIDNAVQLPTLAQAMTLDSPLFSRIAATEPEVIYDSFDLKHLYSILIHLKSSHFRKFVEKFGDIVKELIVEYPPLTMLVSLGLDLDIPQLREILYVFLESEFVELFIQTADTSYNTISGLVKMLNNCEEVVAEEEVTKIVLLMVSYGLTVTSEDLDTVYNYYGRNELFKTLLHMDININQPAKVVYSVATLYYDLNVNLEVFLHVQSVVRDLLSFYNDAKLKQFCLTAPVCQAIKTQAKNLPTVPCLVELSRNVARKYIVNRFKIKKPMQFYTVLRKLPIGEMTKLIIMLEKELY